MKHFVLARYAVGVAFITGSIGSALAQSPCDSEITKIDAQLTSSSTVPPAKQQEARQMRNEGLALCNAGKVDEGIALLAKAKTLLGIG
jgi:hypothetical protein